MSYVAKEGGSFTSTVPASAASASRHTEAVRMRARWGTTPPTGC